MSIWETLKLVAAVLVPVGLTWLQSRRDTRKLWADNEKAQQTRHQENIVRLTAIETKLEPIHSWWNRGGRRTREER